MLADLVWLTALYHMLEMLEVYGARPLYAHMKSMSLSNHCTWAKVRKHVSLMKLFGKLEERYRCVVSSILDEEEACLNASLGAPSVRCCVVCVLSEECCRRRRWPKRAGGCWRGRTRKSCICCALSMNTSAVRSLIC